MEGDWLEISRQGESPAAAVKHAEEDAVILGFTRPNAVSVTPVERGWRATIHYGSVRDGTHRRRGL